MLEGFGLYPVVLQIDPDSYDGDWRHVARFRNRSGWLLVAEAEISVTGQHQATVPMVVGCDEWGEPIPSFIAANLLRCGTSLPQPCDDIPPAELDALIEGELEQVRKRWLRSTNAKIALIHGAGARALRELEGNAEAQLRASDETIAKLSHQRRMLPLDHPGRAVLSEAIAGQEDWQTGMITWLSDRRQELRDHFEAEERKASKGMRPQMTVEQLYFVNWHHAEVPSDDVREAWIDAVHNTRPWPSISHRPLDLADEQWIGLGALSGSKPKRRPTIAFPSKAPAKKPHSDWTVLVDWGAFSESLGIPPQPEFGSLPATSSSGALADHDDSASDTEPASTDLLPESESQLAFEEACEPEVPAREVSPTISAPPPQSEPVQLTLPEIGKDLQAERTALVARRTALEIKGQKFFAGSRKYVANMKERADLARQIAALERRLAALSGSVPVGGPAPAAGRTKRDLEREALAGHRGSAAGPGPLLPTHKERVAWVLNLEALLEHHRPYTGDWFKLNDMLVEARAALRGDGKL